MQERSRSKLRVPAGAEISNPLRDFRSQIVEMKRLSDPFRGFRSPMAEMKRLSDPLKDFRSPMAEIRRLSNPLTDSRSQVGEIGRVADFIKRDHVRMAGITRLSDPLKDSRSQIVEMTRLSDPLRDFRSQIAKMTRLSDSLQELRVRDFRSQIVEMTRLSDPLRDFRSQIAKMTRLSDSLQELRVRDFRSQIAGMTRLSDPFKELRVQALQINSRSVDLNRVLNEIVKPTTTLVPPPFGNIGVFIEPDHPEVIEHPAEIHYPDNPTSAFGKKVFIVCGKDKGTTETVARRVEKLGLEAIIIDEQPSGALTRIEKVERYTDDVTFTVVLFTPEDVGKPKDKLGEPSYRASQDVILQLGILIGKYGRDQICFLCKGELELPSSIDGITLTPIDDNGGWVLNLIREMEYAGLSIDISKAI